MTRKRFIRRWLWNGAVVMSLVMMVGVGMTIVVSFVQNISVSRRSDGIPGGDHPVIALMTLQTDSVEIERGIFDYAVERHFYTRLRESVNNHDTVEWALSTESVRHPVGFWDAKSAIGVFGVRYTKRHRTSYPFIPYLERLQFPLIYPLALTAIIPALWLTLWYRNRHKRLPNHCRQCGYNLTGTISAGRTQCSECGAEHTQACD